MKHHLLLGMTVGTAALLGIASLLNRNPLTDTNAAPLMAAAFGVLAGSLWVIGRSTLALLRQEEELGWAVWRQAALGAITIGVILYLQGIRSLSITEASLITLAAILFELFFRSDKIDSRRVRSTF